MDGRFQTRLRGTTLLLNQSEIKQWSQMFTPSVSSFLVRDHKKPWSRSVLVHWHSALREAFPGLERTRSCWNEGAWGAQFGSLL